MTQNCEFIIQHGSVGPVSALSLPFPNSKKEEICSISVTNAVKPISSRKMLPLRSSKLTSIAQSRGRSERLNFERLFSSSVKYYEIPILFTHPVSTENSGTHRSFYRLRKESQPRETRSECRTGRVRRRYGAREILPQ